MFQTAFIGDVILSIPLLKNIRRHYPQSKIVYFCRPAVSPFLLSSGLVDSVIEADKGNRKKWRESLSRLHSESFDLVFCPHESLRSAFAVRSLNAKKRIGYYKWWNRLFFDSRVRRPMDMPEPLRQLSLLAAESASFRVEFNKWVLENRAVNLRTQKTTAVNISDSSFEFLMDIESQEGKADRQITIGLAPGSVWETKKWPWLSYAALAKDLIRAGHQVLLFGSSAEKEICQKITQLEPKVQDYSGEGDLSRAFERMKQIDVLVSNDSGLMHVAAAAGTPTVAIFGPTTLSLGYQPWNKKAIVVQKELSCRPCGAHGHKKCPIGTHACMKEVSADEVLKAVNSLLPIS